MGSLHLRWSRWQSNFFYVAPPGLGNEGGRLYPGLRGARSSPRSNLGCGNYRPTGFKTADFKRVSKIEALNVYRLSAGKQYTFSRFDANNRYLREGIVELPCDVWISRSADGKSIEIEIQGKRLGEGGFNAIYKAPTLTVDMSNAQHAMQAEKFVTRKSKNLAGSKAVQPDTIFAMIPEEVRTNPNFRAAGITTHSDRINPKTGRLESRDVEGIADWWNKCTHSQQIQILQDAATSLELLHAQGLVHRDFKPGNMIAADDPGKSGRLRGWIIDWDSLSTIGKNKGVFGTPGFADSLAYQGIATPLADIYALAMSVRQLEGILRSSGRSSIKFNALMNSAKELTHYSYQRWISIRMARPIQV